MSVRGQGTERDGCHPQTRCTAPDTQGPAEASAAAAAEVRCGHLLAGPPKLSRTDFALRHCLHPQKPLHFSTPVILSGRWKDAGMCQ